MSKKKTGKKLDKKQNASGVPQSMPGPADAPIGISGWLQRNKLWIFVFLIIAPIAGLVIDLDGLVTLVRHQWEPKVDVVYFEIQESGQMRLIGPEGTTYKLGEDELRNQRLSFPVNLAVRNVDGIPLDVVRVELRYPKTLAVKSSGKAKIDPSGDLLVYEHDIGLLENINEYTPLQSIDTLTVPMVFALVPSTAITKDGVPILFVTFTTSPNKSLQAKVIDFGIRIFSKDRPALEGTIRLIVQPSLELILPYQDAPNQSVSIQQADLDLFANPSPHDSEILDEWSTFEPVNNVNLHYLKLRQKDTIYQIIRIDDQVRRLLADVEGDGLVDYDVWDDTMDGRPDHKNILTPPVPSVEWTKESAVPTQR